MDVSRLPAVNAGLNATSAILLFVGWIFIRQRAVKAHTMCMTGAFGVSVLFLISYLYYHFHHGSTPFPGQGWARPVYFTILISHTVLAAAVAPMAIVTFFSGLLGRFERHKKLARVTFPVWLYVSMTGVVIYWMLYQMKWN